MKTKKISFILMMAFAASLFSCTSDDAATDDKNQTENTEQGTTFVGGATLESGTRTSLSMTFPGGTAVNYFWEKGDKIWTVDGSSNGSSITGKTATALFQMARKYYTPTVQLYYPGQNATTYNQVNIATEQEQIRPNNTDHLGKSGDCGTAVAYQQGDGRYAFNLDHKAAYLCLLPRSSYKLNSTYITKIKVTADNNIAGTYTLTPAGLTGGGSSNVITLTTKGVGKVPGPYAANWNNSSVGGTPTNVDSPGFPITNIITNQTTNAAYIVIAPGHHALSIEYTYIDCMSKVGSTVVKTLPSAYYAANTVYPITANINNFTIYPDTHYYMWDAKGEYWMSGKNTQPKLNWQKGYGFPKPSDFNYFNSTYFHPGSPAVASLTAKDAFNINEALWYAVKGEPTFDENVIWVMNGHIHKGGLWIKKRVNIPNFNSGKSPYNFDLRLNNRMIEYRNLPISVGRPADLSKYFFLPAFGLCNEGVLRNIGFDNMPDGQSYCEGFFWTSTPQTGTANIAFLISFIYHPTYKSISVVNNRRYMGFTLMTSEDQFRPTGM